MTFRTDIEGVKVALTQYMCRGNQFLLYRKETSVNTKKNTYTGLNNNNN